jgi:hypothetical protein
MMNTDSVSEPANLLYIIINSKITIAWQNLLNATKQKKTLQIK